MPFPAFAAHLHLSPIRPTDRTQEVPVAFSRVCRLLLILVILSATVLSRFGINLGTYSLNSSLIAVYVLISFALLSGNSIIDPRRLFAYYICVAVASTSFLVNKGFGHVDRASWTSLFLLVAIYFPFVFVFHTNGSKENQLLWVMRAFSNIALFCACAGIAQFFAQFFIHSEWLFDFSRYIPTLLQGPGGYNTVIPVGSLYKSNGFFFREPSLFSFAMALALLGELALYKRLLRIALLGLALLLSYSGTGLLALFIGLMFPLGRRTIVQLLWLLGIGGLVVWLLGDVLNLSFTLGRVQEFGSERSSAYIRYIAPMRLLHDSFDTDAWTALFGHGPGTIQRTTQGYEFHDPTWAKLIFEYGLLGFMAFLVLVMAALNQRLMSIQVRAALFFCWLIMGGHLLTPETVALVLALVGFWTKSGEVAAHGDNHALHFANVGRDYISARPNQT
jgi:hypothetical protein